MAKKQKEIYIPKVGLMGNGIDYNYYEMSTGTKVICFIAGLIVGGALGYLFYEIIVVSILIGCGCGFLFQPMYRNSYIERRKKALTNQFKDMLESLSTSLGAGSNVQDSFLSAYKDMCVQYTEDSYIAKELAIINAGIYNNISVEALLSDMGDRSGIGDIMTFANVFETCYRKGGNIRDVIKNTHQILVDKMDIDMEIKTIVASKKSEQNLMLAMPIMLVAMMKAIASDIVKLNTPTGRISTTVAVVLFVVAYFMGKKILTIKV